MWPKHIKETKIKTKEHNNRQTVNICIRNLDTNKDRYSLDIFVNCNWVATQWQ